MSNRVIDENGFIEIKDNPLSKVGVFDYLGSEIDAPESDKIYKVFRSEEVLKDSVQYLKGKPFVNDHTMLGNNGVDASEKGVEGVIGDNVYYKDGVVYGNLRLFTSKIKELIEGGKKALSCGYWSKYIFEGGTWEGQGYDAIQQIVGGNHIALVDSGRMGQCVAVLDSKLNIEGEKMKDEDEATKDEEVETATKDEEVETETKDEEVEAETKDEEVIKDSDVEEDKKDKATQDTSAIVAQVQAEIKASADMYDLVQSIVGTFDYSSQSASEIAKYAADKLGLDGDPVTAISVYAQIMGAKSTMDSKDAPTTKPFLNIGDYS